jgi:exosome complex RNA-binding protein Rrp42 (RNase PH superfamily)
VNFIYFYRALDCDSLCILAGKYAWDIKCELTLLNNDGNLLDAFNYASIIALQRYKLPFVTVESGKLRVWSLEEKRPQTLSIHHWPILMTFGVLNEDDDSQAGISEYVVFDPSVRKFLIFLETILIFLKEN